MQISSLFSQTLCRPIRCIINTRDCYSLYDYRPNSTPISLTTITYLKLLNNAMAALEKVRGREVLAV